MKFYANSRFWTAKQGAGQTHHAGSGKTLPERGYGRLFTG